MLPHPTCLAQPERLTGRPVRPKLDEQVLQLETKLSYANGDGKMELQLLELEWEMCSKAVGEAVQAQDSIAAHIANPIANQLDGIDLGQIATQPFQMHFAFADLDESV